MQGARTKLVGGTLAVLLTLPAWSASLQVSAVSLRLPPDQAAMGLTLSNPSDEPLVARVRLFVWGQGLNEDHLSAQQELMLSPAITTLPAHSEQVVRIVRPTSAPPIKELTYRLLVDELPALKRGDPEQAAEDIRIRYSIPLFVSAAWVGVDPPLSWSLVRHEDSWFLRASNAGGTSAQVSAVKLLGSDGRAVDVADGLLGYALSGSTRQWKLTAAPDLGPNLQVAASINGRGITSPVEFAN